MNLPSKKLLSEVLEHIHEDKEVSINGSSLEYFDGLDWAYRTINIYELMHMMKEWACSQSTKDGGYAIKTVVYEDSVSCGLVGFKDSISYDNKTEFDGVVKTCEWLIDNRKK